MKFGSSSTTASAPLNTHTSPFPTSYFDHMSLCTTCTSTENQLLFVTILFHDLQVINVSCYFWELILCSDVTQIQET